MCADTYTIMVQYFLLEIIQTEVFQSLTKELFFFFSPGPELFLWLLLNSHYLWGSKSGV